MAVFRSFVAFSRASSIVKSLLLGSYSPSTFLTGFTPGSSLNLSGGARFASPTAFSAVFAISALVRLLTDAKPSEWSRITRTPIPESSWLFPILISFLSIETFISFPPAAKPSTSVAPSSRAFLTAYLHASRTSSIITPPVSRR